MIVKQTWNPAKRCLKMYWTVQITSKRPNKTSIIITENHYLLSKIRQTTLIFFILA